MYYGVVTQPLIRPCVLCSLLHALVTIVNYVPTTLVIMYKFEFLYYWIRVGIQKVKKVKTGEHVKRGSRST